MANGDAKRLSVSAPQGASVDVEYYGAIERVILITNDTAEPVLVEEIALRFQSDRQEASIVVANQGAWEILPGKLLEHAVAVTPNARYLAYSNVFDVKVRFRSGTGSAFAAGPCHEVHRGSWYIRILQPSVRIGQVFISVKMPDDEPFGRIMEQMATRAGFVPFLKATKPRFGQDIWTDVIEPALIASDAVLVIWTDKTEWGIGVQREVQFCRDHHLSDILLLQDNVDIPAQYQGTTREYQRFDPRNPGPKFAETLDVLRESILARRR